MLTSFGQWLTSVGVTPELVAHLVVIFTVFMALQISAAMLVYMERKVAAFVQQRYGPYLLGPRGLLAEMSYWRTRSSALFTTTAAGTQPDSSKPSGRSHPGC